MLEEDLEYVHQSECSFEDVTAVEPGWLLSSRNGAWIGIWVPYKRQPNSQWQINEVNMMCAYDQGKVSLL